MEEKHVRRIRYKGKYPKSFEEKYKEHQPEKYQTTIEKVIAKGNTPVGTHRPIMVNEILKYVEIIPNWIGIDATLGYGGHTEEILKKMNGIGHLYCLDVDGIEIEKTKKRLNDLGYSDDILTIKQSNFCYIDQILPSNKKANFILADLGVSSMQIDNPRRGFSFKNDGPLDLRLNSLAGIPAYLHLQQMNRDDIVTMLEEYADEPHAREIANMIVSYRMQKPIETTKQLAFVISKALSNLPMKEQKEIYKKTCQRVFQALRIEINSELDVLTEFLDKIPDILDENGIVVFLTFHSGEDRLVKKAFKYYYNNRIYKEITRDVIRPQSVECFTNPRCKSTKLRYAIRSEIRLK